MTLAQPTIGAILEYHPARDDALLSGHAVRPAIVTAVSVSAGALSVTMTVFDGDGSTHARSVVPHATAAATPAGGSFWTWPPNPHP